MSESPVPRLMAEGLELLVRQRIEKFVKEITLEVVEGKVNELNDAIEASITAIYNKDAEEGSQFLKVMTEITMTKGNMR